MKKKNLTLKGIFLLAFLALHCSKESGGDYSPDPPATTETPTLTANNFSGALNENSATGTSIGTIQATASSGAISYSLVSQSVENAISINPSTGEITVNEAAVFDYETHMVVNAVVRVTSGSLTEDVTVSIAINDVEEVDVSAFTLWEGPIMTFTKEDGADENAAENQDRITENVIITRASAGQLFNIAVESSADQNSSPVGTEWARGTFDDLATLEFTPFRAACPSNKPKNAVGIPMVVHLIDDDIYIQIKLVSWGQGKAGGFSYERTTQL